MTVNDNANQTRLESRHGRGNPVGAQVFGLGVQDLYGIPTIRYVPRDQPAPQRRFHRAQFRTQILVDEFTAARVDQQ